MPKHQAVPQRGVAKDRPAAEGRHARTMPPGSSLKSPVKSQETRSLRHDRWTGIGCITLGRPITAAAPENPCASLRLTAPHCASLRLTVPGAPAHRVEVQPHQRLRGHAAYWSPEDGPGQERAVLPQLVGGGRGRAGARGGLPPRKPHQLGAPLVPGGEQKGQRSAVPRYRVLKSGATRPLCAPSHAHSAAAVPCTPASAGSSSCPSAITPP
jgi:hypothetical protein